MKNLGIQLTRHGQTTRRPRWVVWLLGAGITLAVLLYVTGMWFSRSELLVAAPTGTQIAIELTVSPRTVPKLQTLLDTIPLISHRAIELRDVLPYTKGKMALFVLADGTTAVALKAKKEELPTNLLDAQQITVQDIGANHVLLSETLLPISPIQKQPGSRRWIPDVLGRVIGTVTLPEQQTAGSLIYKEDRLSFEVAGPAFKELDRPLPKNTSSYLSTQVLTNDSLTNLLSRSQQTEILKSFLDTPAWLFLTNHEGIEQFLIWSPQPASFDRHDLIAQISANLNPVLKERILQDGTIAQEIVIDPDLSSIEEITLLGRTFLHSRSQKGEEFFLSSTGDLVFSNNETDVRSFLAEDGKKPTEHCGSNLLSSNLSDLIEKESTGSTFYTASTMREIAKHFKQFGVNSHKKSMKFLFCP